MPKTASLKLDDKELSLPMMVGTEGEKAVDIGKLRAETGYITYDDGFGNTGSCTSNITFIDGEVGILRYRGYPIEQLAEGSNFVETAYLVIHGELPTKEQRAKFSVSLGSHSKLPDGLIELLKAYPKNAHPMSSLSSALNALTAFYPQASSNNHQHDLQHFEDAAAIAISQTRTIAAQAYRLRQGLPLNQPRADLGYCDNFLHLMFSEPGKDYVVPKEVSSALNLFLLLHADHEQNCSTSTVKMVASAGANVFASASAGVNALWGPLHGGANQAVLEMLKSIHAEGDDGTKFIAAAKSGKGDRLMGFGHRVYKNYDPRAKIIKASFYKALASLGIKDDPLLNIAMKLEEVALSDDYFISRKLYPNVDFYSGLIMRAMRIPENMFTVMFAMGRMPGWIAQWHEVAKNAKLKIYRPRQIYMGATKRDYVGMEKR